MEFSFDRSTSSSTNDSSAGPATESANERLQKAIERNRERQRARMAAMDESPRFNEAPPRPKEEIKETKEPSETIEEIQPRPTRRAPARPQDTEFAPVRRNIKKADTHLSYTPNPKKRPAEINPKLIQILVRGSWFLFGILFLRLLFARGGIMEYQSQKSLLSARFEELKQIKNENMALVGEIERMQTDSSYQRKLVRDNLGFIANDEFLILFPRDKF